jgi:hypothetical protein
MTKADAFQHWWDWESEKATEDCATPYDEAKAHFLAGQRSGFSLATEAAAKALPKIEHSAVSMYHNQACHEADAERIRALRYEDVKGEKDVPNADD